MSLNWKEIDLILAELNLPGSFIQQIYQPVHQYLIFDLHRPGSGFKLLIALAPGACRLHTLTRAIPNPQKPQRFASFLRARIKGGRIISAAQLEGERIIKIVVRQAGKTTWLWLRLWSGAANLVVTDETGKVLDACYRRKSRNEVSGGYYNPETELAALKQTAKPQTERQPRQWPGDDTYNAKIEAFYSARENGNRQQLLFEKALRKLDSRLAYHQSGLESLQAQRGKLENYERAKEIGDLILANLHRIEPESQWLVTEDFYHNNQQVEIELKKELTARGNAEMYYQRHKDGKKNLLTLDARLKRHNSLILELQEQRQRITDNQDPELIAYYAQLEQPGQVKAKPGKIPGLQFHSQGYTIYVGRNAAENVCLLRQYVRGNDYWFHARDYAGGYVFIKTLPGKSIPLSVMLDAGNLAVLYSQGKNSGKGDVYYTQVKYLRKVKQGKPGKVIPTSEKNLYIVLDTERLKKLKKNQLEI